MAVWNLLKENTGISAANLPLPTMYSPVGSTSQPCGDFGQGIKYTISGNSATSNTVTSFLMVEVAVWVSSLYLLCAYFTFCFLPFPAFMYSSAFFQFTAIIK